MKFNYLLITLLSFLYLRPALVAQIEPFPKYPPDKQLIALNARLGKGWNTWDTRSVLTHVLLPEGFSIKLQLFSHQAGDTLKEASIGREDYGTKEHVTPGLHAYDGSYTELVIEWQGVSVQVQTAAENNNFFLLVTPLKKSRTDSLFARPGLLWNRKGEVTLAKRGFEFSSPTKHVRFFIEEGNFSLTNGSINFSFDEKIVLSSVSKTPAEVEKIIDNSKRKMMAGRASYKESQTVYDAMQTALSWNVIYEPSKERVITPVSRNWSLGWQGWILFEWDNYLAAYMLSLDNKDLAYANAIAITKEITKKGFVPNFASSRCKSEDRSEPPVGSLVVNEIYKKFHDKWFLDEVFQELLTWNRWWSTNRDVEGYLCWASDPYEPGKIPEFLINGIGKKKGAQWESGLDNSPMWDDAVFDTVRHCLMQADVGLMSLYILDCKNLCEIATSLGNAEIAKELTERAKKYSDKLETLWDDQFGLYLNKDLITGKFSHRISPTLFYPLLTGVPDQKQAGRMINEHYYNPEEFWGEFIMPSIARNDPAFKDNKYWRGRIWAPMNFLVYLGLRNYQFPNAQKDMVEKSKDLLLKTWNSERHVYENYNATSGVGNDSGMSDPFYHWGALLGFIDIVDKGYMPAPQKRGNRKP